MNRLISLLLSIFFLSCQAPSAETEAQDSPVELEVNRETEVQLDSAEVDTLCSADAQGVQSGFKQSQVRFATLMRGADSLMTKIEGFPFHFTLKQSVIWKKELQRRHHYQALFYQAKPFVKQYTLHPGRKYSELRFWFVEAIYPDQSATDSAFAELKRQSRGEISPTNAYPGLTYTNDFLVKRNKAIYWFNTGCNYTQYNHQILKEYLLQSLPSETTQDSIRCECGAVDCS